MNIRKWHKFRVPKHKFPTREIQGSGSTKGANIPGHIAARKFLEEKLGIDMKDAIKDSNKTEWIFKFPIGQVPKKK